MLRVLLLIIAGAAGEKVYFTSTDGLYAMEVDGSDVQQVIPYSETMCDVTGLAVDEFIGVAVIICSAKQAFEGFLDTKLWQEISVGYDGDNYRGVDVDRATHTAYLTISLKGGFSVQPFALQGCGGFTEMGECDAHNGCEWTTGGVCERLVGKDAALMRIGSRMDTSGSLSAIDGGHTYCSWVRDNLKSSISYEEPSKGTGGYSTPVTTDEAMIDDFVIDKIHAHGDFLYTSFLTKGKVSIYTYNKMTPSIDPDSRTKVADALPATDFSPITDTQILFASDTGVLSITTPCVSSCTPTPVYSDKPVSRLYYRELPATPTLVEPPQEPTVTPTMEDIKVKTETVAVVVAPLNTPVEGDDTASPTSAPATDVPSTVVDPDAPVVGVTGAPSSGGDNNNATATPDETLPTPQEGSGSGSEAADDNFVLIVVAGSAACLGIMGCSYFLCYRKERKKAEAHRHFVMEDQLEKGQEGSPYFLGFGDIKKSAAMSEQHTNPLDQFPHEDVHHDLNTTATAYDQTAWGIHHANESQLLAQSTSSTMTTPTTDTHLPRRSRGTSSPITRTPITPLSRSHHYHHNGSPITLTPLSRTHHHHSPLGPPHRNHPHSAHHPPAANGQRPRSYTRGHEKIAGVDYWQQRRGNVPGLQRVDMSGSPSS